MPNRHVSRETNGRSEVAWPLCVVSSSKQTETLPHQRSWAIEMAAEKGWALERIGDFEDDSNGKKGPRKLVRRLVAEIRQAPPEQRPQWVLMLRLDRVGRGSIAESQFLLHELNMMGVRIWTRDGGEEKNDSATDEFIRAAKLFTARHENDIRSEKATASHARKKRAGEHTGGIPYGMVLIDRRLRPFEAQAAFIRDLFEKRARGWGLMRLAKYAHDNAPPKILRNGTERRLCWTEATIARVLENQRYRGAIVDESLFDEVKMRRGTQAAAFAQRPSRYAFPLRGAIRCTCGAMLTTTVAGDHKFKVRYYVCRGSSHVDQMPYHNADHLEAHFARRLAELTVDGQALKASIRDVKPLQQRRDDLQVQIDDLRARERRVWALGEDEAIDREQLRERLAELKGQRATLEDEIKTVEQQIVALSSAQRARSEIIGALNALSHHWESNPDVEMRREAAKAVAAVVEGMYVAPQGRGGARKGEIQFGGGDLADGQLMQALAGVRLSGGWAAARV